MRRLLLSVATALVFAVCNGLILQKEQLLARGAPVLLKLAPVDPRSLIQGDYMALRYEIAGQVPEEEWRGAIVLRTDESDVATFVRVYHGEALASGERLLRFRRKDQVRFGAESFFFQEGDAERYRRAKYGELKVAPDGSSVLIGLRDEKLEPLGRVR